MNEATRQEEVELKVLDIATRWRMVHQRESWRRGVGGGILLFRDLGRLLVELVWTRPQVVHLVSSGGLALVRDLLFLSMCKLSLVPAVYHLRFGRLPEVARGKTLEWSGLRWAMWLASTVVAIDEGTEETLRRLLPAVRIERIPNCTDLVPRPERPREAGARRVAMYLGWIIPAKGMAELVEAWRQVGAEGWRLKLVGPGAPAYVEELLAATGGQTIEWVGELDHGAAMDALAEADLFILPSYTEGFPNVVLEAMALGKAVVATSVGAIPEMLSGGCGILVEPQDVASLAAALGRVMEDEGLRAAAGEKAAAKVRKNYGVAAVFGRLQALWTCPARRPEGFERGPRV